MDARREPQSINQISSEKPMKIRTEKLIDVDEWDKLVEQSYSRPYSFQQQDGCKDRGTFRLTVPAEAQDYENDAVPEEVNHAEMGVSFAAWLKRDPSAQLQERSQPYAIRLWWERNFYPDVQMIANDLHAKGRLEAGEYLINIDW